MTAFTQRADVANRALQYFGTSRILSFSDQSVGAVELAFMYDKVREAEQRRNLWKFSLRRAALRPITTTTRLLTFGTYNSATTYAKGDVVADSNGNPWISLQGSNTGNSPLADNTGFWEEFTGPQTADAYSTTKTYSVGEIVLNSTYFISLANNNTNNATSGSPWLGLTTVPAATPLVFVSTPIPNFQQTVTRSLYYLPTRFLRVAPQDPKAAGVQNQLISAGQRWSDYEIEGNYLITATNSSTLPLIFRYGASIELVPMFDALFCEGIAARMGKALAPRLDPNKDSICLNSYDLFIREARQINAIEYGTTERADDLVMPVATKGGGGGGGPGGEHMSSFDAANAGMNREAF